MFVEDVAKETEGVGEALRSGALPDTHHPVLLWVEDTPLWVAVTRIILSIIVIGMISLTGPYEGRNFVLC